MALLQTGHTSPDLTLRARKFQGFSIEKDSTAGMTRPWVNPAQNFKLYNVYWNCNFSIYSGATCNGQCPFCVEKLRPLSRGWSLDAQKACIQDDDEYFASLNRACSLVRSLNPSVSITGGEPSIDPRLTRILSVIDRFGFRKRTITTNGSGLRRSNVVDLLIAHNFSHLNISRAHFDQSKNQAIMQLDSYFSNAELTEIFSKTQGSALRPRLSCVIMRQGIHTIEGILSYLEWAASIGVDNVVFRQLMAFDRQTYKPDPVIEFVEKNTVSVGKIIQTLCQEPSFNFLKQVVGYYYYVEVFQYRSSAGKVIDVVFEEADLSAIEEISHDLDQISLIHEFILHPNGHLCSKWQPWDGILL